MNNKYHHIKVSYLLWSKCSWNSWTCISYPFDYQSFACLLGPVYYTKGLLRTFPITPSLFSPILLVFKFGQHSPQSGKFYLQDINQNGIAFFIHICLEESTLLTGPAANLNSCLVNFSSKICLETKRSQVLLFL